jgi:hypothetical protein
VNEPKNKDVGGEYREFDAEDAVGGNSSLFPFDAC